MNVNEIVSRDLITTPPVYEQAHRVCIVQALGKHYRLSFFEHLNAHLQARRISLTVIYSDPNTAEATRGDSTDLPHPYGHKVRAYWWLGGKALYQNIWPIVSKSDLIILEQANKYIMNYPLLLLSRFGLRKVAYWGHGRNYQSTASYGQRERWKRALLCSVDWWFTYTKSTVDYLTAQGYPGDRITCLNNAIDTSQFRQELQAVPDDALNSLRMELKLDKGSPVGLYCGSLYQEKRLDLMVAAADIVHQHFKGFSLIVIGNGPSSADLRVRFATRPWAHWVGPKKGIEKATYFRLADVVLNPGLVGLNVLDAFCAGLPMITTATAMHSPEVGYLENGVNGIITGDDPDEFARAVVRLLSDQEHYRKLSEAALSASKLYTVEEMANRFADGIYSCLQVSK